MSDQGRYSGPKGEEQILRRPKRPGASASRQATSTGGPGTTRPSSVRGRELDETREAELLADVSTAASRLRHALAGVLTKADGLDAAASMRSTEELDEAERAKTRADATWGNRAAQGVIEHRSVALDAAAQMAPGPAGLPWSDPGLLTYAAIPTEAAAGVRLGTLEHAAGVLTNELVQVPWIVPLLDHGSLTVASEDSETTDPVILSILARLLASTAPGQLVIDWFDPRLRTALSPLAPLRQCDVVRPAMNDVVELEEHLGSLIDTLALVAEQRGGTYRTLGELNRGAGQAIAPYRVCVLFDFPSGVSKRAFQTLQRLINQGYAGGVHFIIQMLPNLQPDEDFDPAALTTATHVSVDGATVHLSPSMSSLVPKLDEPPSSDLVAAISDSVAALASSAAAPSLDFGSFLIPASRQWSFASKDRLEVCIGMAGTTPASFSLGDQLEQLHNVLIGGAVGTGKSNLLLVLLHDLAAKYSPGEVEMYLLDFKEGLEFAVLAPSDDVPYGLPHARVLGLETDRLLGLQVLRRIEQEFTTRSAQFKTARVANLASFREARPDVPMPRLLLVVDEFQVLIDGEDNIADESVRLLETLARKGRAYGIHLVLASQTLSGVRSMLTKEGAILSQFPIRIGLRTTPEESQVLLSSGNRAASDLRFRGQAILNTNYGNATDNRRIVVARADPEQLDRLRKDLWQRRPPNLPEPFIFNGHSPAALLPVLKRCTDGHESTLALVGVPVGLHHEPVSFQLSPEPGRHLALVGMGDSATNEVAGTLHAAVLSTAMDLPPGQRFVIVDLLTPSQRTVFALADLGYALVQLGQAAEVVEGVALPTVLSETAEDLSARAEAPAKREQRVVIVGAGLHGAIRLPLCQPRLRRVEPSIR